MVVSLHHQITTKTNTMTTIKITLPTKKAGQLSVYTIQFSVSDFDAVVDAVSGIRNYEDLINSTLWKVI